MKILHNLSAMNAHRRFNNNSLRMSNSMEKLSSGLRINQSADDAAGLAISEKMRGQIRGLKQAERNVQDGTSLVQAAEGGLNEVHSTIQRIRELVVQASNDTYSSNDRKEIKEEIDQLKNGIDNIANNTEFNTIPLLNRTKDSNAVGEVSVIDGSETQLTSDSNYDTQPSWVNGKIAFNRNSDIYLMDSDGTNQTLFATDASQPAIYEDGSKIAYVRNDGNLYYSNSDGSGEVQLTTTSDVNFDSTFGSALAWNPDGSELVFKTSSGIDRVSISNPSDRNTIISDSGVSSPSISPDGDKMVYEKSDGIYIANTDGTSSVKLNDSGSGATFSPDGTKIAFSDFSSETSDEEIFVMNIDGTEVTNLTGPMATASSHDHNIYPSWSPDGNFISFHSDNVDDPSTSGDIWTVEVSSGTSSANHMEGNMLKLHVGANSKQNFDVILTDARTSALGLNKVNVLNHKQAGESLNIIDQAIQTISSERSKYGAYQNAFEHISNNLQNYNEQITTSESRIRDVDMAKEIMKQTQNSILSQASQAILAQANQTSQGVVQLLR